MAEALLLQELHVQIAVIFEPRFVGLGTQRPDQSQAARRVREDAHYTGAALDLFVEPLEQVGRLQVLVVLAR